MSDILVSISSIAGESALTGYDGQIECVAMSHVVDLPVVPGNAARVEGTSRHGAIEFTHLLDIASPGLRLAVSAGQNLGEVVITRHRMLGGESRPVETITISDVYVVRVDLDTPVNANGRPEDEPHESFSLEYSRIVWESKRFTAGVESGSVTGGFDLSTASVV